MRTEKANLKGRTLRRSEIKSVFQTTKFVPSKKRYLNRQPNESVRDAIERARKKEWWAHVATTKPFFNARFWWWSLDAEEKRPTRRTPDSETFDEEEI
jgi:hypothetical protein